MFREIPKPHVDSNFINELSRSQQLIMWLVTVLAAAAGLQFLKAFSAWLLQKLYDLFIQRNIFNL
jgi:hypothetical protein